MPEQKNEVRTLAVRVSPDFHALLLMVAQVDDMSLTDLMMKALEGHVEARRQAEDFKAKVQAALAEEQARMARTQALLLGPAPDESPSEPDAANPEPPATGRSRRSKEEAAE
jgi:uncharacterized protein (DUF1778 family)